MTELNLHIETPMVELEFGSPGPRSVERENDYDALVNQPQINGVTLKGNKSFEELGEGTISNAELSEIIAREYDRVFGGN